MLAPQPDSGLKMKIPVKSEPVRARLSEPTSAGSGGLSNLQLATMAIAAAVTASNLYYCQPLLSQIARSLHMTARETADIPMLTQVGYALGLLFFAPLGDMVERRGLATALLLIVTVALVGTTLAPDAWVLLATSLITGMFSVVPQVMAPMAAALSKPEAQGRAVGIVMGGMLIGILLARTVAGFLGTWWSPWRHCCERCCRSAVPMRESDIGSSFRQ
jgi:predicted MFS family arabinose efflux permease